jgi:hypothetical protein
MNRAEISRGAAVVDAFEDQQLHQSFLQFVVGAIGVTGDKLKFVGHSYALDLTALRLPRFRSGAVSQQSFPATAQMTGASTAVCDDLRRRVRARPAGARHNRR